MFELDLKRSDPALRKPADDVIFSTTTKNFSKSDDDPGVPSSAPAAKKTACKDLSHGYPIILISNILLFDE